MDHIEPCDFVSVKIEVDEDQNVDFQNFTPLSIKEEIEEEYEITPQDSEYIVVKAEPNYQEDADEASALQNFEFVAVKHEPSCEEANESATPHVFMNSSGFEEGTIDPLSVTDEVVGTNGIFSDSERSCLLEKTSELTPVDVGFLNTNFSTQKSNGVKSKHLGMKQKQDDIQIFTCDECSAVFMSKLAITNHVMSHIDYLLTTSNICKFCGFKFSTKFFLNLHLRICQDRHNSIFTTEDGIRVHSVQSIKKTNNMEILPVKSQTRGRSVRESVTTSKSIRKKKYKGHISSGPYTCDICNKSFTVSYNLTIHKRIHTGIKPYTCDICSKSFGRSDNLAAHKLLHTQTEVFECDICSKSFKQFRRLTIHKRIHSGIQLYSCDICFKSFAESHKLSIHKRTHSDIRPHRCDICSKSFKLTYQLTIHKRIHSGIKPFSCDICFKSFRLSDALNVHRRVHSGIKPYNCDVCSKSFRRKQHLKKHLRVHSDTNL